MSDIESTIRKATTQNYDNYLLKVECAYGQEVDTLIDSVTGRVVSGYSEFYGTEEIVRAFMQKSGIGEITLYLTYTGCSESDQSVLSPVTVSVLYNDPIIKPSASQTAAQLTAARFLNTGSVAWLYPNDSINVWYWWQSLSERGSIYKTKLDGTEVPDVSFGPTDQEPNNIQYVGSYWRNDRLMERYVMGSRSFKVYYLNAPEVSHFRFRNAFNLVEPVSVPAALSSDPKTEFEEAQLDKMIQRYDIEQQIEFTVKTGPLPRFMYNRLLAMCRSRFVQYREMVGSPAVATWRDVIVSDYKLKKSDEPNTYVTLEMKFKYVDTTLNEAVEIY